MTIDDDAAYQVFLAHDARFDGKLFVGVTSTGIYCRPICRVRTPSRRNCRFFATPAQAEAQAFRPCLKCRPEVAPGPGLPWTVMEASRTLARQASAWLDTGLAGGRLPDSSGTIAALSSQLGISDRHLRRIFFVEHGVTPLQYLQTRRLLLAKQLLTDSQMPIGEIALSSGFRSLRRFNAAFVGGYRMNPSRLRRASIGRSNARRAPSGIGNSITVTLGYRPPHDHVALLEFVALRAIPGIEAVDGLRIRRTLRAGAIVEATGDDVDAPAGWLEACFDPAESKVRLAFAASLGPASGAVIAGVRRWLDLDAAPEIIDAALAGLPGAPGLRLPGSIDGFELAVRAVLGQQVSVACARTLASRLVERFGAEVSTPWLDVSRVFPAPNVLAATPIEGIAELGIIRSRAKAIQALAGEWPVLARLLVPGGSAELLVERLQALPGIGPWTAHYIAMRGLGWPDAFPAGDAAALKAMRLLFPKSAGPSADARTEAWRPWRSYALLRLWNSLSSGVTA
ncbi:MAG: helix-turn-helix domain-containing protein [Pseudomonadota bacterium]|nr:helix-turn-helix domain-containing protein [Pseudomonadota bacterium]